MSRRPRLKIGDIVQIDFLDHVEDGEPGAEDIELSCFGRIIEITKRAYRVEGWGYTDPEKDRGETNSTKQWTIIKRAIERVTVLEPKGGADSE